MENHDTTAGHAAPASSAAAPQIRVLIVEDHPDTGRTLARLLRRKGFAVTLAGDIATALATLGGGAFDVLVSDVGLPDGTGHELMARVRATYPLPAIAMSGYGMEEDVRRSHEAGFSEHLVKPIDITQLIAAIQRIAG